MFHILREEEECFNSSGAKLEGGSMGGVTPPPKNTNYLDWQAIKDCK